MSRGRPPLRTYGSPEDHPIGRYIGLGAMALLVLMIVVAAFSTFYTVDANEQAVVLRYGRYHSTQSPGAHFRLPFVDQVLKVSVAEQQLRLPGVEGVEDLTTAQLPEDQTLMLTGDLNAASVEWTIQWRVKEPKEFLFAFYDRNDEHVFERVFRTAAQSVMNRLIGDYSIDEVLTDKRTEVAEKARSATQAILDDYDCGVLITDLQMQRVTPPESVKPAFDAVNASIQERDRLENEANKERNTLIPKARAERDKLIREAEGYADRRKAEVDGEVTALRAKYEAYSLAPEETRRRLYLEAMQEVLQNADEKVILDSDLGNLLPLLPLDRRE
ncbi:MAG: FtsH protease activity modulator HflK [Planctomycetota bacterium]|nr:FtsH protease activity modulator HflK [Planctomycetaceae bacterium]MDQ3332570.1 FtsH protease activity modulator HflK [Planctomycetota bacterium]